MDNLNCSWSSGVSGVGKQSTIIYPAAYNKPRVPTPFITPSLWLHLRCVKPECISAWCLSCKALWSAWLSALSLCFRFHFEGCHSRSTLRFLPRQASRTSKKQRGGGRGERLTDQVAANSTTGVKRWGRRREREGGGRLGEVKRNVTRKLSVGGKWGGTLSVVGWSSSPAHTVLTNSMSEALCSERTCRKVRKTKPAEERDHSRFCSMKQTDAAHPSRGFRSCHYFLSFCLSVSLSTFLRPSSAALLHTSLRFPPRSSSDTSQSVHMEAHTYMKTCTCYMTADYK